MIRETVARPYVPEKYLFKEGIRKVGVGLLIVDPQTSKLWFIEELKDKDGVNGTGRKKNTISIPLETRKKGEKLLDNVVGALAEFRPLQGEEELVWFDGYSYLGRFILVEGVAVDMVRIGIRNRTEDIDAAVDSQEVQPVGWKTVDEIVLESQNVRAGVPELLQLAAEYGWIEELAQLIDNTSTRTRILSNSMDLERHYLVREQGQDI